MRLSKMTRYAIFITCLLLMAWLVFSSFPIMTGPRRYDIVLASLDKNSPTFNRVLVYSPSKNAWFANLGVVISNGRLDSDQDVDVTIHQRGQVIASRHFLATELINTNPNERNSFPLSIEEAQLGTPLKKALGYGAEFEVSASVSQPRELEFSFVARFVDDRLFK